MEERLRDPHALIEHVMAALHVANRDESLFPEGILTSAATSAVLFLLGERSHHGGLSPEPSMVFSKRSRMVRQPGDLCFPGGRISTQLDSYASNLLRLPFMPLTRWPYWPHWRELREKEARQIRVLLTTALRESFEEMRLNPFTVRFLGPMPSQPLEMFQRILCPMVVWIHQRRFLPNWEVERLVHIPIRNLLEPSNYACYRILFKMGRGGVENQSTEDFPCFRHLGGKEQEVLWGVTYRIVMVFLEIVFNFRPPEITSLPVIHEVLDDRYLNGSG